MIQRYRRLAITAASVFALGVCMAPAQSAPGAPDFTFIQASDVHTPMEQSRQIIGQIKDLGPEVDLQAYGIRVLRPTFAIVTGDCTEFGGGNGWWTEYLSYWKDSGLTVYSSPGNHDNTWHAQLKNLRDTGLGAYYSFNRDGCHFISLNSPTIQDPRPSFGEEQIVWLRNDLRKVSKETPVFIFFHHPLEGTEFASRYDWYRVVDLLRPYNVALVLTGHYHNFRAETPAGLNEIIGGSTFGPNAGLMFVSVKDGVLRAAYQKSGQNAPLEKVLEKKLADRSSYPTIDLKVDEVSASRNKAAAPQLRIEARVKGAPVLTEALYTIDDDFNGDLKLSGNAAVGLVPVDKLLPGAHYVRVTFKADKEEFSRSAAFTKSSGPKGSPGTRRWRHYLAAASKNTPTIAGDRVYVGDNAGKLSALKARDGKLIWSVNTSAEVIASPLVHKDTIYCANGNGDVSAYDSRGKKLWTYTAPDSVYSSPVWWDGKVIFGCNDGRLYAVDAATGRLTWKNEDPEYSIESTPFVKDGRVYFGAWDQYVRCVDASTGKLLWKTTSEGVNVAKAAKRYYSPGDAMPVVAGGKVYIADRNYWMTILDAVSGENIGSQEGVAATGVSEDGRYVYMRMLKGQLNKIDTQGHLIWSTDAGLGAIPTAPVEKDGKVFVCSARGMVSAIDATSGKILWQYQASPQLFVMSSVSCDGDNAYVTSFDGNITAVAVR
ncbi:MAG: PQQ-binding-like beta-propeller repeat protein [Armatimonadetes bacterium]|nr:PQQ-binding-like beta-propeller repeat protein [Armatimonadota bacterium]